MNEQRFPILFNPFVKPLLTLFGATPRRFFVKLQDEGLRVRFDWLFNHLFPYTSVERARRRKWPLLFGLGWRTNFPGLIGLIGSSRNVFEIEYRGLHRVTPMPCQRLAISLQDPDSFLEALGAHIGQGSG